MFSWAIGIQFMHKAWHSFVVDTHQPHSNGHDAGQDGDGNAKRTKREFRVFLIETEVGYGL